MNIQQLIEEAWEKRTELSPASHPAEVKKAVTEVLAQLDGGKLRVAE